LKQAGISLEDWDNSWQIPCRSSRPASPNPKIKQANQCIASVWIYTSSLWIKNKPKIGREICICCCQNSWKNDDMVIKCFQLRIKGVPPPWEFTDRSRAGVGLASVPVFGGRWGPPYETCGGFPDTDEYR
jgi:hypothetical protein